MEKRQRGYERAFRRAQRFLDDHAAELGTVNETGARTRLDAIIARVAALELAQDPTGFQRATEWEGERRLREVLRRFHMRPIASIARARLQETPEFAALRVPSKKVDRDRLLVAAEEMAAATAPHAAVFVAYGLPADFIDRLHAARGELAEAGRSRDLRRSERIGATAALHVEVKEGNRMLAILDSLLAPALASRPDLAAEWRSARRALVREGAGRGEDAEMKVVSSAPSPVGTEVATAA